MADRTDRGSGSCGIVLALCLSVLLAGCVSTQEPSGRAPEVTGRREASTTVSTTPTTTTATTTPTASSTPRAGGGTTIAPRAPADRATVQLARAAVLKKVDFGPEWHLVARGAVRRLTPGSCSYRDGGPEQALGAGAVRNGPTMQLQDLPASIRSSAFVFPTEADAVEWIGTVRSAQWAECVTAQLGDLLAADDPSVQVVLDDRRIDGLGRNGFEAYTEFHGRDERNRVTEVVSVMHYRMGRVVLEDTVERSTSLGDDDWSAVDGAHSAALANAWSRLLAARSER
jgi:hypothetical protein